jgi:hypothetical protein
MITSRRLAALGCLLVVLATLAGCGLPVDSTPQAIPAGEVPVALSVSNTTQPSGPVRAGGIPVPIYFLSPDGTQLDKVIRYLRPPPTAQKVLDALEAGPTAREFDQGLQSALPATADLVAEGPTNGLLTVQLDSSYESLLPQQAPYYFAQIVWSVTSLPGVRGVNFEYQDNDFEPVVGNGSISPYLIVYRYNYSQLAPAPS